MTRPTRSMAGLTTTEVIRCIKDGSRDLTQVIYRQIPEMDIFDVDGTLRGEPLYRVNYCGNHCSAVGSGSAGTGFWNHDEEHDHLLWCVGDEQLFRCRIATAYRFWTSAMKMPHDGHIYIVGDLCRQCGVTEEKMPKAPLHDVRVVVEPVKNKYALEDILLYEDTMKDGIAQISRKPFKSSNLLVKLLNETIRQRIHTWSSGQEMLMALPQLYLTGLRR